MLFQLFLTVVAVKVSNVFVTPVVRDTMFVAKSVSLLTAAKFLLFTLTLQSRKADALLLGTNEQL